ncbi:LysR substrate-binding domain-containing protein [Companilactobacillus mishanensis]
MKKMEVQLLINYKIKDILSGIKKSGSITETAQSLYISQPYVSKIIKEAEDELDIALLDRGSKHIQLSYAGQIYLEGLNSIDTQFSKLDTKMREIAQSQAGQISIGISESLGEEILPMIVPEFIKQYPNYQLNITELPSKQIEKAVIENQIDVYIGFNPPMNNQFVYRKMSENQLSLYTPQIDTSFPEEITDASQLLILNQQNFISISEEMVFGEIIKNFLSVNKLEPRHIIEVKNINTAISLANKGVGYAILPPQPNSKSAIPISKSLLKTDLIMAHRAIKNNTPEMIAFLKISQQEFHIDPDKQTIQGNTKRS